MVLWEDATATLSDCKLEITLWNLYRGRIGRQTGSRGAAQDHANKSLSKSQSTVNVNNNWTQKKNLR